MNRAELVDVVARSAELPPDLVEVVLLAVLAVAVDRASRGERTSLGGLGYFWRASIAARAYRNPRDPDGPAVAGVGRSRLAFTPSQSLAGLVRVPAQHLPAGEGRLGSAAVLAAAEGAGAALSSLRQASLTDAGHMAWRCDGEGEGGRGAWVRGEVGGWSCASGAAPFLAVTSDAAGRVLNALTAAIKVALFQGGEVELMGFGRWSVKTMPARLGLMPVWSGGTVERLVPAYRGVHFAALVRP